jgi:predicted  nucleic acid-binding Zn-ribbon protein
MKLTLRTLTEIQPSLTKLANISFPAKRSFELMPMFEEINALFKRISTEIQKLHEKKNKSSQKMFFADIVTKEFNDFLDSEVEIKEFIPIYQSEIPEVLNKEGSIDQQRSLSMADFLNLKDFILKSEPKKNG